MFATQPSRQFSLHFVIVITLHAVLFAMFARCAKSDAPVSAGTVATATPAATTTYETPAAMAAARDYSLGYCNVALNAPGDCIPFRGKRASGVAPGCQHADCTAAKLNARTNLLTGIPAQCGAYIQCNDPCSCIQKTNGIAAPD